MTLKFRSGNNFLLSSLSKNIRRITGAKIHPDPFSGAYGLDISKYAVDLHKKIELTTSLVLSKPLRAPVKQRFLGKEVL